MADKPVSKPKEPPKPVHIGGESLVDRILPHIKKIIVTVIVLSVVITVILAIRWWKHHGQEQETEKLAQVLGVAQRHIAVPGAPADPKSSAFATAQERAKAVLDEMNKQGSSPPGHAYRGGVLLAAGDVDASIEEYRRGQDAQGIEGVLTREGLGIALEAKAAAEKDAAARGKLLEEALAVFQRMQPDEKGPRRAYALYHQGRVQVSLGKPAEAKALFEKATELVGPDPGHELHQLIEKRLAALEAAG
jgi:predicted negative regulator of RcsB-dependent stress response